MATSPVNPKAPYHTRSISLPSRSNPLTLDVTEQLNKVRASQSTSSICQNLVALRDLYNQVDDLILFPMTHGVLAQERSDKCVNEMLDGSLELLDVCGTTRDILSQMKQTVQDLQSSLRRNRGDDSSLATDIIAYKTSKKKVIRKCLGDLKRMEKKHVISSIVGKDQQLVTIINILREVEAITYSVFGSILSFITGPKTQSKSLLSKLMHPKRVGCKGEDQAELEMLESSIQELEEDLDCLFKCLIKTRVSLLNCLIKTRIIKFIKKDQAGSFPDWHSLIF